MLKKSVLAGWPAKCYLGTIWVYRGDHPSLPPNFKPTFPPILQQAEYTQVCSPFSHTFFASQLLVA